MFAGVVQRRGRRVTQSPASLPCFATLLRQGYAGFKEKSFYDEEHEGLEGKRREKSCF